MKAQRGENVVGQERQARGLLGQGKIYFIYKTFCLFNEQY